MAWEPDQMKRTLFIVRVPGSKQPRYTIHKQSEITTPTGETYMEPLPMTGLAGGTADVLQFNEVKFIDPPKSNRNADAGNLDIHLMDSNTTNLRSDG